MEVVLVDTSAWVEFSRATGSGVDLGLRELMEQGAPIASTEPIAMELFAGATSDKNRRQIRKLLAGFIHLPFSSTVDFSEAARIFRACRAKGFTPRSQVDCMIAAVALRRDATVLTYDADFEKISAVTGLRIRLN